MESRRRRYPLNMATGALVAFLAGAWVWLGAWGSAAAQYEQAGAIGGLPTQRPVVPESIPRPFTDGNGFMAQAPQEPVESFVDSLKGNDAAFQVVVGQGRLLTLKQKIASEEGAAAIALGDPSVIDFRLLPNSRLIRILGLRPGVTDLSVTTADGETVSFEVHVTYDLILLKAHLRQLFPSAKLRLAQIRDHLVVEGQARSTAQSARIIETLEAYLESAQAEIEQQARAGDELVFDDASRVGSPADSAEDAVAPRSAISADVGGPESSRAQTVQGRVINLIRIPGVQQVMLRVRIAELDRTALRAVGADLLVVDPDTGNIIGTRIGGAAISAAGMAGLGGLIGEATGALGNSSTAFGIFPSDDWQIILRLLRQNNVVRVLAEPNLIAMSGHQASFLAGGEFPVPVPQASGGGANSVTVEFREFGVRLGFLPYVLDEDRIRLSVTPEVSTIDESLGTTLVVGGDPVPGLSTRRANATVELRSGQTLAMAGLLSVELDGQTSRIPGLGDLPYIGPFFSNTTQRRQEKELVVLVTPHLIEAMEECEVPPLPGDSVEDPTDFELYLRNQYEGRQGINHRSTVEYGIRDPRRLIHHERRLMSAPVGFSN